MDTSRIRFAIIATAMVNALSLSATAIAAGAAGYLGAAPSDTPRPFTPPLLTGFGSTLTCVAFAPGMRHVVLSAIDVGPGGKVASSIHETTRTDDEWSSPAKVVEIGDHAGGEVAFSADGRWLYFSSDRPPGGAWRPRAFRAPVVNGAIGAPELVPLEVATEAGVYYPRPLPNGDLFFTSRGPVGGDDLFMARARAGGGFEKPRPLDGDFNSPKDDWDLVESPDGNLRIWVSAREGSLGKTDLFFSRRDSAGTWSRAGNLKAANTAALETAPALTPDGEVLFFLRREQGRERMFWVRLASVLEN